MTVPTLFRNRSASRRRHYRFHDILSAARAAEARRALTTCPRYRITPLWDLPGAAELARVDQVLFKDESSRFTLGSFKGLGGSFAVCTLLAERVSQETGRRVDIADLARGLYSDICGQYTFVCASDGNHGMAVAEAARIFGSKSTIFLHEGVSSGRESAIRALGASVVRAAGNYDASVRDARKQSELKGHVLVQDTSDKPADRVPLMVMQGYATIGLEVLEELHAVGLPPPTHVFLQGGVGGLAAAIVAQLWETLGPKNAPIFVVVEPVRADCLYQSAQAGVPTPSEGDLNTIMACLSCGEVSRPAWPIIHAGVEFFMRIPDEAAVHAMRLLANGSLGRPLVAGESGAAGLAGLFESQSAQLSLPESARVLVIGTEGATDPAIYAELVGSLPAESAAKGKRA